MNHSDKTNFKDLMDGLSEYYRSSNPKLENLSVMALQIYFGSLQAFTFDEITSAVNMHVADTKAGQFFPKAADLIKHLTGGEISNEIIIAAANLADTPLGCLARIHIGSWDLNNQDGFYLRQRAAECLLLLPEWKRRAAAGDYSDHEISVMLKLGVNPLDSFAFGIAAPANSEELKARCGNILESPKYKFFIEPPFEHEDSDNLELQDETAQAIKALANGVTKQ